MNRKRVLVWVSTLSIVGSASGITYTSAKTDTTKNVVVTVNDKSSNNVKQYETISNEEATKMVKQAMENRSIKDGLHILQDKIYSSVDATNQNKEFNKKYEKGHLEVNSGNNVRHQGDISDDEALKMATEAMKNYMGIDAASYFESPQISRSDEIEKRSKENTKKIHKEHPEQLEYLREAQKNFEKNHPEEAKMEMENLTKLNASKLIFINYLPNNYNEENYLSNNVIINEKTGEIVTISAANYSWDQDSQFKMDDTKIKNATLSFFEKTGKKIKGNAIKVEEKLVSGLINVHCILDDGREAEVEINPNDYSIVAYSVNFNDIKIAPSLQGETRDIEIN